MDRARFVVTLLAIVTGSALAGCSGGAGGATSGTTVDGDAGTDGGYNDGWQGQTNIEAIFEASCSGCHGAA